MVKGRAIVSIYFLDVRVEDDEWLCQRFGTSSNALGNLHSKEKFHSGVWLRPGIAKVIVTKPCEGAVLNDQCLCPVSLNCGSLVEFWHGALLVVGLRIE
jgi:hypothetical protein